VGNNRFEDAEVLHREGHHNGAIYLAGYAIECLLKSIVLNRRRGTKVEDVLTHDLDRLLHLSGLSTDLLANREFHEHYMAINGLWNVNVRYLTTKYTAHDARKFLERVELLRKWLLQFA
jgi:HEPN domain-containing protein